MLNVGISLNNYQTMYKETDKMCDLIAREHEALHVIGRFGLPLGVEDKTIREVCDAHGIHTMTFLTVVNYELYYRFDEESVSSVNFSELSLPTLISYLRNAHSYFFDFAFPMLRKKLIEAINYSNPESKIPMLIIRFFDEYVNEISIHMQHENEQMFPYVEQLLRGEEPEMSIEVFAHQHRAVDDQHIANKLSELKSLIIKYYPETVQNNLLNSALYDIFTTEHELATHCAIEDVILLPAVRQLKKHAPKRPVASELSTAAEPLSEREKDVLVEVVKGLSNKEIADVLCISPHTVISHRKNISKKLKIHSTAGLTIYAIVNNMINLNEFKDLTI